MNLPQEGIAAFVTSLSEVHEETELAIAPPFPFIPLLGAAIDEARARVLVGAQNCSERDSGAFTGEVSAPMLRATRVEYVIVGHSERRQLFGEDSGVVGRKVVRVVASQLRAVMCVGENQEMRDAGRTAEVLERQLREAAAEIGTFPDELVIAYEPVWAIGTGRNATPRMAAEAHGVIRSLMAELAPACSLRILYGGSVTPDNAAELAREEEVDGFLVGGASLVSDKFRAIAAAMR